MPVKILAGLIAVKDLEIKTLTERLTRLEEEVMMLTLENKQLYLLVEELTKKEEKREVGFKRDS